jgi:DNA-binding CsgD family transcriptional regulator
MQAGSLRADLREQSLALVDSAYALAMSGEYARAVAVNEDGLAALPEDSLDLRCEFWSCLLYCYHRLGDYERALAYGELCLDFDERQGDPVNLSASLGNLAGIYSSAGQHEVAVRYLERAIDIEQELLRTDSAHTPKSLAIREAMLGEVLLAQGKDLERALALTEDAYAIDRRLGRRLQEGMRLAQLGHICAALGRQQQARDYNTRALAIARETGNRMTEVLCLLQLERYEEAAALAHESGLKKQEYEACDRLYQRAADNHQYSSALRYLERARALHEELMSEESQRQLTVAQVRYDTFRKERQLAEQKQEFLLFSLLALLIVVLLTAVVLLLRRRKNTLEQEVLDKEQQYSKLAFELKQFYGKDIATLMQDIADAKAKNMHETALTKREQQIVKLCCEGLKGKEMAEQLGISIRAVNSHKTNIFNKLGLSSTVELVRYALENGII